MYIFCWLMPYNIRRSNVWIYLCNNKQELNLSATDAVYEMHENNFLRSLTDLKSPALLHRGLVWGYQYASLL